MDGSTIFMRGVFTESKLVDKLWSSSWFLFLLFDTKGEHTGVLAKNTPMHLFNAEFLTSVQSTTGIDVSKYGDFAVITDHETFKSKSTESPTKSLQKKRKGAIQSLRDLFRVDFIKVRILNFLVKCSKLISRFIYVLHQNLVEICKDKQSRSPFSRVTCRRICPAFG